MLRTESGYPVSVNTCSNWVSQYGLAHTPLRDQGGATGVAKVLAMQVDEVLVMDRYLKIVYRGNVANGGVMSTVVSKLAPLK